MLLHSPPLPHLAIAGPGDTAVPLPLFADGATGRAPPAAPLLAAMVGAGALSTGWAVPAADKDMGGGWVLIWEEIELEEEDTSMEVW